MVRGGARDEEVDEEVSGREREQEKNITMEDLYKALGLDFWTANDPERRDEGREGELQGSDEDADDHLIEFASRLETGKCFQRQVETTDKKVQEARRQTRTTPQSPRRKRRRKR